MTRSKMHPSVSTRLRSDSHMSDIPLGQAPPETVLPEPPPEAEQALADAMSTTEPLVALASVASRWPRYVTAWAALSEQS